MVEGSEEHLFRGVTYFKSINTYKLRVINKPVAYTTARSNVLRFIESIGLETKYFGIHSLRAGGASAAANNNTPDRLFKKDGRWLSENAKDGYVKEILESILSVSLGLGI